MGQIWSVDNKFRKMLDVEIAVAKAQAAAKMIPRTAAQSIQKKAKFRVDRILELESTLKHDVIAFVTCLAESVGEHGKYIHYGLTSSDVLDTAQSLLFREAQEELMTGVERLEKALARQASRHATTLCAGRTHGMHAEITSFGVKMVGHLAEVKRCHERLDRAFEQVQVGKLSGAVGIYTNMSPELEAKICKSLKLQPETIATQVVPRDRHAELLSAMAILGCALERLALELRHLQRTEVGEVIENFTPGQKGSSAMPHKKNPISAENITGVARLLRGYQLAALENVALWHERDISHSSVERVILPDAFIVLDYALHRMAELVEKLYVVKNRMARNMELSQGQLLSSQILVLMVKKGFTREEAYKIVQEVSHGLKSGQDLLSGLARDVRVNKQIKKSELQALVSEKNYRDRLQKMIKRVVKT
jgi:adenylosuccinate lyase